MAPPERIAGSWALVPSFLAVFVIASVVTALSRRSAEGTAPA